MKRSFALLLAIMLVACGGGESQKLEKFAAWMDAQSNRVLHELSARLGPSSRIIPPGGKLGMNFAVLSLYLEGSRDALDAIYVYMNYQKWKKSQDRRFLIKALSGFSHIRKRGINREKLRRLIDEGARRLRVVDVQELNELLMEYQRRKTR